MALDNSGDRDEIIFKNLVERSNGVVTVEWYVFHVYLKPSGPFHTFL